ncbi:MAG: carotenoid biosynthesis protein [Chloroflexi bacterium]|nr:MAG: carotenoid biosynthesis protein [Chloroflexota bacterium]
MPNTYFTLFEGIIYLQLALCLHHAWKQGVPNLLRLFVGILFGVALELATIRQLHAYEYGQFLIMVLDVPLCIGIAWSCVIYSSMEFSDASSLPYWTRPILDGLLALNIDLALDAVAIRLGFWDWGRGLGFQYFGVPYANFWAWFWVVCSFSLGYRLFAWRADWVGRWLSPLLALIVALIGVLGTNSLISFAVPFEHHDAVVFVTLVLALVLVISLRPRFYLTPVPSLVFWVPFLTHAYLLAAGLISGVILEPPILLVVAFVMLSIAFYLHRPITRNIFQLKARTTE